MNQFSRFGYLIGLCIFSLSSPAFARDWKTTDPDLPAQLRGLDQGRLNTVNKTKELNPSESSFNPAMLDMFLQGTQNAPVVRTGHDTTVLPPVSSDFSVFIAMSFPFVVVA